MKLKKSFMNTLGSLSPAVSRAIPMVVIAMLLMTGLGLVFNWIETFFGNIGTVVAILAMGFASLILFVVAKDIHKGKENIVDMMPALIMLGMFGAVIMHYTTIFDLVLDINSISALAFTLAVVYFAEETVRKLGLKIWG